MADVIPTLEKQSSESRLYSMDFTSRIPANSGIASISSVTITSPAAPTTPPLNLSGVPYFDGKEVFQKIDGGKPGTSYVITVLIIDTDSNTLEGEGRLNVIDRG